MVIFPQKKSLNLHAQAGMPNNGWHRASVIVSLTSPELSAKVRFAQGQFIGTDCSPLAASFWLVRHDRYSKMRLVERLRAVAGDQACAHTMAIHAREKPRRHDEVHERQNCS